MFQKVVFESDEQILISVRRHWFFIVVESIGLLCVYLAPFTLAIVATHVPALAPLAHMLPKAPQALWLFIGALWTLILWMAFFVAWTNYYLDTWTVTNSRVMVINQRGLFRRSIASFRIDRLQEINIETDGIIATLLDFGTIHALTAGHDDEFIMVGAPEPEKIKNLILDKASTATRAL